jgi:hypothetical protein
MAWIDQLTEQLDAEMRTPSGPVAIVAYRYRIDERTTVTREGVVQLNRCSLTLLWQDGSISCHTLSPPVSTERLPVLSWTAVRYFDREQCRLPKPPAKPLPNIPVCDPGIVSLVTQGKSTGIEGYGELELAWHKQTVGHSRGLSLQAEMTEARVSNPLYPFVYESRRLPSNKEARFLQAESAWFGMQPLSALGEIAGRTKILLSPQAFRRMLFQLYCPSLHDARTREAALPFFRHMATASHLRVRYDPLVPWSLGSCPFTPHGTVSRSWDIMHEPELLPPDPQPAAFHWDTHHPGHSFREWLTGQPDVLYIPDWHLPRLLQPWRTIFAWAPRAYRFRRGRPTEQGSMTLPVSLASVITSPEVETVRRTGWDTGGLALPCAQLIPE